jgi:hypothetical protein
MIRFASQKAAIICGGLEQFHARIPHRATARIDQVRGTPAFGHGPGASKKGRKF